MVSDRTQCNIGDYGRGLRGLAAGYGQVRSQDGAAPISVSHV